MSPMFDRRPAGQHRFICFEGIDGAGKSSLAGALVEAIRRDGQPVVLVDKRPAAAVDPMLSWQLDAVGRALWDYPRAPGQGEVTALDAGWWLRLLGLWFALVDQAVVRPALAAGITVVADGWTGKYAARFGAKAHVAAGAIDSAFSGLTPPSDVLLIDADPVVALHRRGVERTKSTEVGAADGHVGDPAAGFITYQTRVRSALRGMTDDRGWTIIDSPVEPVAATLDRVLDRLEGG